MNAEVMDSPDWNWANTRWSWRVTTWILFRVPATLDLHDTSGPQADLVEPIRQAKSHHRSAWGRVESDPELTVLFSLWENRATFEEFATSSSGQSVYGMIAAIHPANSSIMPHTLVVTFPSNEMSRITLHPHTHIRAVFFPESMISDESALTLQRHPGPTYPIIFSALDGGSDVFDQISAFYHYPKKGWVESLLSFPSDRILPSQVTTVTEDQGDNKKWEDCKIFFVLLSWRDAEKERHFRETGRTRAVGGMVPVMMEWEDILRQHGAVGWKDFYVDFSMVQEVDRVYARYDLL